MITTKDTEKNILSLDSLNQIPLIAIMERSGLPWGIKDTESRFVYMNQAAMNFCNIPKGFDFEGRLDEELPVAWYDLAPELKAHDRKAESSKEGAVMVNKFCRRSKRHSLVHDIFDVALNNQLLNGVDNNYKTECNFQLHRQQIDDS